MVIEHLVSLGNSRQSMYLRMLPPQWLTPWALGRFRGRAGGLLFCSKRAGRQYAGIRSCATLVEIARAHLEIAEQVRKVEQASSQDVHDRTLALDRAVHA